MSAGHFDAGQPPGPIALGHRGRGDLRLRPPARRPPRRSARPDRPITAGRRRPGRCDRRTAHCGPCSLLFAPRSCSLLLASCLSSAASSGQRSSPQVAAPSLSRNRSGGGLRPTLPFNHAGEAASSSARPRSVAPSRARPSAYFIRASTFSGVLATNFSCHQKVSTLKKSTATPDADRGCSPAWRGAAWSRAGTAGRR